MKLNIHNTSGNWEIIEVNFLSLFDLSYEGEIGIFENHTKGCGLGKNLKYENFFQENMFLYEIKENEINIYLF
jgi:hypothetical protein